MTRASCEPDGRIEKNNPQNKRERKKKKNGDIIDHHEPGNLYNIKDGMLSTIFFLTKSILGPIGYDLSTFLLFYLLFY